MMHRRMSGVAFLAIATAAAATSPNAFADRPRCPPPPPPIAFGVVRRPPNRRSASSEVARPLAKIPPPPPGGPPGKGDGGGEGGYHSYVEGIPFDGDAEAEILAMGGDPFFLTDDDGGGNEETEKDGKEESDEGPSMTFMAMAGAINAGAGGTGKGGAEEIAERFAADGLGPLPEARSPVDDPEEWDGWEIEDAHFD